MVLRVSPLGPNPSWISHVQLCPEALDGTCFFPSLPCAIAESGERKLVNRVGERIGQVQNI